MSRKSENTFREFHRYLGFFLAGIMAVYAISGIVLTFRNTDFLKKEFQVTKNIASGLTADNLGSALNMRFFKVDKTEGEIIYFGNGTYNSLTGEVNYIEKRQPWLIEKMNKLHKMHQGNPLFWLGVFFGVALLFFSVSAFFMFRPSAPILKKGCILPLQVFYLL